MKKLLLLTACWSFFALSAGAVCCCDDDKEALQQEIEAFSNIKSKISSVKSDLDSRAAIYGEAISISNGTLVFGSKATAAAAKLKDAVSMKESFEGLAANSTLDAARIDNAIMSANLRESVGEEAKKFSTGKK